MKIDLIELTSKIADKMLEEESSTEFKKRIIKEKFLVDKSKEDKTIKIVQIFFHPMCGYSIFLFNDIVDEIPKLISVHGANKEEAINNFNRIIKNLEGEKDE